MTDEISYFEVASFLAEIESVDIDNSTERRQWLVARVHEKWPALTASQAVAYGEPPKVTFGCPLCPQKRT